MNDPRSRSFRLAAAALLLFAFGPGCSEQQGGTAGRAAPADTLIVAMQGDADSLDPHMVTTAASMRMIENMYSTLLRYGEGYGDFEPDLAQSVAVSDDGLTYTIRLNELARFHSGRPVTAKDVVWSLQRIRDEGVRGKQLAAVESIEESGEAMVVLHLSEPSAPLRSYLAHPMNAIIDRQAVEQEGVDLRSQEAGSGPYKLGEWRRGQELRLQAHGQYHVPGLPRTPQLVYRVVRDATARTASARMGEVHILHEVPAKDRPVLEGSEALDLISVPGTFWEYLGLNTRRPPLDDPRVRQAIAWAVDREQINELVKFGTAQPLRAADIPPNHWAGLTEAFYTGPDVGRAQQLLREAGHGDGFDLPIIVDATLDYQVRAAEVIKQQLSKVAITASISAVEPGVFYERLNTGDFSATLVGWMGFVDPDQWMYDLFHSQGQYNQQGFSDDEVDALLDRGRRVQDREERAAIYHDAQRRVAKLAPMVFLYVNPQTSAVHQDVTGYTVHPTGTTISLRDAAIKRED